MTVKEMLFWGLKQCAMLAAGRREGCIQKAMIRARPAELQVAHSGSTFQTLPELGAG